MSIEKFTGSTKATPPSDQSVLDFLRQSPDFSAPPERFIRTQLASRIR